VSRIVISHDGGFASLLLLELSTSGGIDWQTLVRIAIARGLIAPVQRGLRILMQVGTLHVRLTVER
jgi:hypothetical protein